MSDNIVVTADRRFTKAQRLLTPTAFKAVFDQPKRKVHQSHLMAFVRDNNLGRARVGMAITKRKVPTAVARNLIKRHIREQFRSTAMTLGHHDIVFIVKKPIHDINKKELKSQINVIFKKIEKI